jgi:hypothetical protein
VTSKSSALGQKRTFDISLETLDKLYWSKQTYALTGATSNAEF